MGRVKPIKQKYNIGQIKELVHEGNFLVVSTREELAKMIDHTLLKPEATKKDIVNLCEEARKYRFASVCVNPVYVSLAAKALKETDVKVCTVIGFPLGANTPEVKAFETKNAIKNGAHEVDMVINIGALKSGDYEVVIRDIKGVVEAAQISKKTTIKVILETRSLKDEEKVIACKLVMKAKADFVKTSTGFGVGGATIHDVRLMRDTVGNNLGVKASGGIRTFDEATAMIKAGANRIGTSAGVAIIESFKL